MSDPSPLPLLPVVPSRLCFGPFCFDRANGFLVCEGREVALPPRSLATLGVLLDRAGNLVTKRALIDEVWKGAFVSEAVVAEAISLVRHALGDDAAAPTYIQTLHRRGYRFIAPVAAAPPKRIPALEQLAPAGPPPRSLSGGTTLMVALACLGFAWWLRSEGRPSPRRA
ncbi:MAG TPA: winged helix-turn-helix domain-containing protein [Thermoanaerobaculia bacterium]|nr:winged helix-turn-helix domain-containing protein [Thermoanaerobaculia bacterium]